MGLEPHGDGTDVMVDDGTCSAVPNQFQCAVDGASSADGSWMVFSLVLLLVISWGIFVCLDGRVTRGWLRWTIIITLLFKWLDASGGDHNNQIARSEHGLGETACDLDFAQDYALPIGFGLAQIGGVRRFNELRFTSPQNRHMYCQEQANLI